MNHNDYLYIYVDEDGRLWMLDDAKVPMRTDMQWLCESDHDGAPVHHAGNIRSFGTVWNAPLLVRLFEEHPKWRYEVASPNFCRPGEQGNPETSLYRMLQCYWPASAGGWHRFSQIDVDTYRLIGVEDENKIDELMRAHAIWPRMSFIRSIRSVDLARLMRRLLDPRWFYDWTSDDVVRPIARHLGLPDRPTQRTNENDDSRKSSIRFGAIGRLIGNDTQEGCDLAGFSGGFLKRNLDSTSSDELSIVSYHFIEYLIGNWLYLLCGTPHQSREMFIASDFFDPTDATIFLKHVEKGG